MVLGRRGESVYIIIASSHGSSLCWSEMLSTLSYGALTSKRQWYIYLSPHSTLSLAYTSTAIYTRTQRQPVLYREKKSSQHGLYYVRIYVTLYSCVQIISYNHKKKLENNRFRHVQPICFLFELSLLVSLHFNVKYCTIPKTKASFCSLYSASIKSKPCCGGI